MLLLQVKGTLEKVITSDAPVAKRKGSMSSVNAMLIKEVAMVRLLEGYKLPLNQAIDAALRLSIAGAGVSWHTIYKHARGGRGQPMHQIEGAPQHDAEPLLAVAEAAP